MDDPETDENRKQVDAWTVAGVLLIAIAMVLLKVLG